PNSDQMSYKYAAPHTTLHSFSWACTRARSAASDRSTSDRSRDDRSACDASGESAFSGVVLIRSPQVPAADRRRWSWLPGCVRGSAGSPTRTEADGSSADRVGRGGTHGDGIAEAN